MEREKGEWRGIMVERHLPHSHCTFLMAVTPLFTTHLPLTVFTRGCSCLSTSTSTLSTRGAGGGGGGGDLVLDEERFLPGFFRFFAAFPVCFAGELVPPAARSAFLLAGTGLPGREAAPAQPAAQA